jgi:hypothetical protein
MLPDRVVRKPSTSLGQWDHCAGKERTTPMHKHLVWAALLCSTALVSIPALAESASTKGVQASANSHDINIQSDSLVNSKGSNIAAPQSKGGFASRGLNGTCNIHVNNKTGYYITFYFNGNAAGAVGPWGDLYPNSTEGSAVLYGKAVFTDGSVLTFGPQNFTCTGTDFTWTLTP